MALTFYFGSGSPFAWKVWLTLEHKGIAYTPKRLSFDNDYTKSPEFLKINPRGRVPAIVDDGFALYDRTRSAKLETVPAKPLLPKDPKGRALVRRLIGGGEDGHSRGLDLMSVALRIAGRDQADRRSENKLREELAYWQGYLKGDFFAGRSTSPTSRSIPICACRCQWRSAPGLGLKREDLPANIAAWMSGSRPALLRKRSRRTGRDGRSGQVSHGPAQAALFLPPKLCNMPPLSRGWADSTRPAVENRPIAGENCKLGRTEGASLKACLQGVIRTFEPGERA
jgi:glutathione S-transferase